MYQFTAIQVFLQIRNILFDVEQFLLIIVNAIGMSVMQLMMLLLYGID